MRVHLELSEQELRELVAAEFNRRTNSTAIVPDQVEFITRADPLVEGPSLRAIVTRVIDNAPPT